MTTTPPTPPTEKTHGVAAPNAMAHNVDLDIFTMCAALWAAIRSAQGALIPIPVRPRRTHSKWEDYPAWKGWDWKYPDVGSDHFKYGWG